MEFTTDLLDEYCYSNYGHKNWKQEFNELLHREKIIPLQILIDNYSELVLINWMEKFLLNPSFKTDKNAAQEWKNSQKKIFLLFIF